MEAQLAHHLKLIFCMPPEFTPTSPEVEKKKDQLVFYPAITKVDPNSAPASYKYYQYYNYD